MTCDTPATIADAAEWRADTGLPAEAWRDVWALVTAIQDEADRGCPVVNEDQMPFTWSGGCVTANGYAIEMSGIAHGTEDIDERAFGGLEWQVEIVPTDAADGTWPTGAFDVVLDYEYGEWSGSESASASWTFEDAGTTGLPLTGTLDRRVGDGSWGCSTANASNVGEIDGCAFDVAWSRQGETDAHAIAVGDWTVAVEKRLCGSRWGELNGAGTFLDDDWAPIVLTDADADRCAVEDCDCDDADPAVLPGVDDEAGDGRDLNCDGDDGTEYMQCGEFGECAASVDVTPPDTGDVDSGDTDTSNPVELGSDTAVDPGAPVAAAPRDPAGCGCAGASGAELSGLILATALLATLRRSRVG